MQILEVVSGDLSNKFILEQLQWLKGNRNEAHLLWQVVWKTGSFSNFLKANSKLKRCYFDFSHEKGRQKGHWMIISLYHSQKTLFFLILVQLFSQPVALMAWRITINSVLTFYLHFLGSNSGLVPHATDIQHRWTTAVTSSLILISRTGDDWCSWWLCSYQLRLFHGQPWMETYWGQQCITWCAFRPN